MKALIGLFVLVGLVVCAVYMFGGYRDFDPDKQGTEARAKIKTGMTWKQVVDIAGDQPKYQSIGQVKGAGGVTHIKPGPEVEFKADRLASRIKNNEVPSGFNLVYRFSEKTAFQVQFDGAGKAIDIADVMTMADLLGTKPPQEPQ